MNPISYLVYEDGTGRLLKQVTCPENFIALQLLEGELCVEGGVPSGDFYINLKTLRAEPKKEFTLSALPLPCTVTIEGVEYLCKTQPVFEFDVPGTYQIAVDAGPRYLNKVFSYDYPSHSA